MDNSSTDFAQVLKAAGFRPPRSPSSNTDSNDALALRQFSADGRFVRTIKCVPGQITVLGAEHPGLIQPFRAALLGADSGGDVSLRLGARDVHCSEIHSIENASYLWGKNTVHAVLEGAGVPAKFHSELLEQLGLSYAAENPADELTPSATRRLVILCSLFNKSQILYYERPFSSVEDRWVPLLARLMLEAAEVGSRVMLVTGLERIPPPWRADDRVRILQIGTDLEESPARADLELRGMIGAAASRGETTQIVTRPQMIHRKRRTVEVSLKAEEIANPNLSELISQPAAASESDALRKEVELPEITPFAELESLRNSPSGSSRRGTSGSSAGRGTGTGYRRSPSGKLTKVTGKTRIKYNPLLVTARQWMAKLRHQDLAAAAMPKEVRLADKRRKIRIRLLCYLLLAAGAAAWLLT